MTNKPLRYRLKSKSWPLLLMYGSQIIARFPLPRGSDGDDDDAHDQMLRAHEVCELLNLKRN